MGKGAKKQVATDEWRNGNVEERLEYALVKVKKFFKVLLLFTAHITNIHLNQSQYLFQQYLFFF